MAMKAVGELRVTLKLLKAEFEKGMKESTNVIKDHKEQLQQASVAMLAFGGAMLAAGGWAVKKAADFQFLETRLQALFNSAERGTEVFNEFVEIAGKVPFTLESIVEAGATLAAFLGDQKERTTELLVPMADLAAFMGIDVPLAAAAFGRAFAAGAGAADMLRDRGVLALVALKGGFSDATTMAKHFSDDLQGFRTLLVATLTDPSTGIAGATGRLAATLRGQLSMLKDATDKMAASLGNTLLPEVTKTVAGLTKMVDKLNELPAWLKKSAMETGATAGVLSLLGGAATGVAANLGMVVVGLRSLGVSAPLITGVLGKLLAVLVPLGVSLAVFNAEVNRLNAHYEGLDETSAKLNDRQALLNNRLREARWHVVQYEDALAKAKQQLDANDISQFQYNLRVKKLTGFLASNRKVIGETETALAALKKASAATGTETDKLSGKVEAATDDVTGYAKAWEEAHKWLNRVREIQIGLDESTKETEAQFNAVRKPLKELGEEMADTFNLGQTLAEGLGGALADELVAGITDAKNAFKDFGAVVLRILVQILSQMLALKLTGLLAGWFGGGAGGGDFTPPPEPGMTGSGFGGPGSSVPRGGFRPPGAVAPTLINNWSFQATPHPKGTIFSILRNDRIEFERLSEDIVMVGVGARANR